MSAVQHRHELQSTSSALSEMHRASGRHLAICQSRGGVDDFGMITTIPLGVSAAGELLELRALASGSLPLHAIGTSLAYVGRIEAVSHPDNVTLNLCRRATAVESIGDLRAILVGTSLFAHTYEGLARNPFHPSGTQMDELRALAPGLSLREWAYAYGVTKQAINNWISSDPRNRPELEQSAAALRLARRRHPDLARWLREPLPGSDRKPLDLMRERRWRALRAAARLRAPAGPTAPPSEALRRASREQRLVAKLLGGADAVAEVNDEA